MSSKKTLVVVCGPTAIGKSVVGIELAKKLQTEIISADSRQFYKEMNIGTAKPDQNQLGQVKHHFIGHLSIHDYYNASRYEEEATAKLKNIFKDSDYALMVGGSGLYIDAVCRGVDDLPDPNARLRERLNRKHQQHGIEYLQEKVKKLDPAYYKNVDTANPVRLIRAIEVCVLTGKKYSDLRTSKDKRRNFNTILIGLNTDRTILFDKINKRVEKMITEGLLNEVRSLFDKKHLNALKTVGYRELFDHLDGKISLEQAIKDIKTNTRRYAKRQLTWFKKDSLVHWFEPTQKEKMLNLIYYAKSTT